MGLIIIDPDTLAKLNMFTNRLADKLEVIHKNMEGRGVSPVHAPLVIADLIRIENNLRKIGGDPKNPVPFDFGNL